MLQTFSTDDKPVWFDLYNPEDREIKEIQERFDITIPSWEETREIEASSRLYEIESTLYLTTLLVASADSENPETFPTTFILHDDCLITVRYSDFKSFTYMSRRFNQHKEKCHNGQEVFLKLLDAVVSRMADILEMILLETDRLSDEVFKTEHSPKAVHKELKDILVLIGKKGVLNSKCKESVKNLGKLLAFMNENSTVEIERKLEHQIQILQQDINVLSDHISFLFHKIDFLLNATLGFINIEQNSITKIFSVVAVIFLPPTLIASIYGMNFKIMPELNWEYGYPLALVFMIASAILPYLFFKRKGWL